MPRMPWAKHRERPAPPAEVAATSRPLFVARQASTMPTTSVRPAIAPMALTISRDHSHDLAAWRPTAITAPNLRHAVDRSRPGVVGTVAAPGRPAAAAPVLGDLPFPPRPPSADGFEPAPSDLSEPGTPAVATPVLRQPAAPVAALRAPAVPTAVRPSTTLTLARQPVAPRPVAPVAAPPVRLGPITATVPSAQPTLSSTALALPTPTKAPPADAVTPAPRQPMTATAPTEVELPLALQRSALPAVSPSPEPSAPPAPPTALAAPVSPVAPAGPDAPRRSEPRLDGPTPAPAPAERSTLGLDAPSIQPETAGPTVPTMPSPTTLSTPGADLPVIQRSARGGRRLGLGEPLEGPVDAATAPAPTAPSSTPPVPAVPLILPADRPLLDTTPTGSTLHDAASTPTTPSVTSGPVGDLPLQRIIHPDDQLEARPGSIAPSMPSPAPVPTPLPQPAGSLPVARQARRTAPPAPASPQPSVPDRPLLGERPPLLVPRSPSEPAAAGHMAAELAPLAMPAMSEPAARSGGVARHDEATVPHPATTDPAFPATSNGTVAPVTASPVVPTRRLRPSAAPATVARQALPVLTPSNPRAGTRTNLPRPSRRRAAAAAAAETVPSALSAPAFPGDRSPARPASIEAPLAIARQQPVSPAKPPMSLFRPVAPSAAVLDSARQAVEAVVASGLAEVGPGGAITISRQAQAAPAPPAPPPAPVAVQRDGNTATGGGYPAAAEPEPAAADRDRAAARSMYPHLRQMLLAELRTDRERSGGLRSGRR